MANVIKKASLITILLQFLSVLLVSFYIFHSNKIATSWYALQDFQDQREEAIAYQEILNLKISRAQSLDTIASDPYIQSMVSYPDNPVYIKVSSAVALR